MTGQKKSDLKADGTERQDKIDVFDYLDYRAFLRVALAREKAEGRISGQREVAALWGLRSAGHISWILQGRRSLMPRLVPAVARMLNLSEPESAYLSLLVEHDDAKIPEERRLLMARIARLQAARTRRLAPGKISYWSSWRNAVVREMVAVAPFAREDAARLGSLLEPPASPEEAREALDLLEDLELVERDSQGTYRRTESIVTAGENWSQEAVRSFQESILDLSRRALREIPREERDISTVTFSASPERFRKIRTRIREMRQEVLTLIRTDPEPTAVYHLAVQLFPASHPLGDERA